MNRIRINENIIVNRELSEMKIELRYFTGTGNSLKVLKTCEDIFNESGHSTNNSMISKSEKKLQECDLIGFCFPVYAFAIPRICRKYLKALKHFQKQQKVFVLITAGDKNESGLAVKECERILSKKNCKMVYSGIIEMPINWTTSPHPPFPPTKEKATEIIERGVYESKKLAREILKGVQKHHRFNYPTRYSKLKFYWDYLLFKYMGVQHMWRQFEVYDSCNGCQLCAKICPTNSITFINDIPHWEKTCEQCMRCVNFCPCESIHQTNGGETRGKDKYREPDFRPSQLNDITLFV